jgi:mannuronan 5-epimerase
MTAGLKEIKNNTNNNSSNYQRQEIVDNESIAATQLNSLSPIASTILFNDNSSCLAYDRINRTISLCGGSMDLSAINQIINSSDVLNNTSDENWILNANISIENGAKLFINSTDTDWLRINSTGNRPYSIIVYGSLLIDRTKISSWNSTSNSEAVLSAASDNSTPRSYLLMHWDGTGHMNITNSNINNLGYNGNRGTWGIGYYSGSGSILENNSISSNFRGVYIATNVSNILVANNTIENNSQHGLNLHKAKDVRIIDNKILSNIEHGISCVRECENMLIEANNISDNGRNGIVLNEDTTSSSMKQNILKDNKLAGVAIRNSSSNKADNNLMQQNGHGTTITQSSSYNTISNNSITYSISDGVIVDTGSTDNRIERNEVNHSGRSGVYMKHAVDNAFAKNNITGNFENGMVLLNSAKNVLMNNNVSANAPYNYYLRPNSTLNIIRDTFFENASLRFFDNSSSVILENTDNRITSNNKKVPIHVHFTNATSLLEPDTKNVLVETLDMFAIPSTEDVEIFSISNDFDTNQKHKKWLEKASLTFSTSDDTKASTRYMIGGFPPDTQIMIRANSSFWNAYTSNSTGYIDFVYDGYGEGVQTAGAGEMAGAEPQSYVLTVFEAEANNRPTMATIILFAILIAGSTTFILTRRYLKKQQQKEQQ